MALTLEGQHGAGAQCPSVTVENAHPPRSRQDLERKPGDPWSRLGWFVLVSTARTLELKFASNTH